jgi:hypothetical protein
LGFDTSDSAKNRYRAVEDTKGALDLYGKIDMAWRIDDVNLVFSPKAGRRGVGYGDSSLTFLLHPVHSCGAFIDLAHAVYFLGIE